MLSSHVGLPAPKLSNNSSEALYQAENAALQTQRVIPLFYLPAGYVLGPQVHDATLTVMGTPQLADVWLGAPAQ
jgi:hypothetical protein